jgi:hypothetical protein
MVLSFSGDDLMKMMLHTSITKGKHAAGTVMDLFSVLLVCLFPILAGAVFFRVLFMGGAPSWFFVLQGMIFAGSLGQAVYFFAFGLIRALRRKGR